MLRTQMIADYLRTQARWRIGLVDEGDCGRNARAAIALIDAAEYVTRLDDRARVVVRLTVAGCFSGGRFDPGGEGERIVHTWHHHRNRTWLPPGPDALLEELATAAERGLAAAPRPPRPRPARP